MEFQHIKTAAWLDSLRFRLSFADGAVGVVDLAPDLGDEPGVLAVIRDRPADFTIMPRGRALCWIDDAGNEVDIDADSLRLKLQAERAAAE